VATIRLSMIQPKTYFGDGAREDNLESAEKYLAAAVADGAELVSFPESYPGQWRAPVKWTPVDELSAMAKAYGVYLVGGYAEPLDSAGMRCYNSFSLFGPDGEEVGRYRRTTPRHTPWIYKGGRYWDFDWVAADELPVWHTDLGTIGILMCSEVYATECARAMALKGADLTLIPAGTPGPTSAMYHTWKTLAWARAIENLMFTAVCSNIPVTNDDPQGRGRGGLTFICSPEDVLVDSAEEGVHTAELDLDRLQVLREDVDRLLTDDESAAPWKTKPGILRDWRRDAVLKANPVLLQGTPDELL
jgi:predicted amidohydrolase